MMTAYLALLVLAGCGAPTGPSPRAPRAATSSPASTEAHEEERRQSIAVARSRIEILESLLEANRSELEGATEEAAAPLLLAQGDFLTTLARYHSMIYSERGEGAPEGSGPDFEAYRSSSEAALGAFTRFVDRFPGHPLAARALFSQLNGFRGLGRYSEMLAALEQLIEEHADTGWGVLGQLTLAEYYYDRLELQRAREIYEAIPAGRAQGYGFFVEERLALIALAGGDCERAQEHFERGLERSCASPWSPLSGDGLRLFLMFTGQPAPSSPSCDFDPGALQEQIWETHRRCSTAFADHELGAVELDRQLEAEGRLQDQPAP